MLVEELEKSLNSQELNSIYVLYGEEKFLLESVVKKIKKKFGECINGINYINIDETNINELISDIQTPAFGYPKKLIIIKNSEILKKEGKRKNPELAKIKTNLAEYIEENIDIIKESTIIVFVEENVEKQKLYKTLEKHGIVCEFAFQKPMQIIKRLKSICNAYKVNCTEANLQYLVEQCGQNMQNLINEIRKLIEYAGENGTIQKEDIDLLCTKQTQAVIFNLTDYLGKKQIGKALEELNNLIYNKEPIQKILITLYNHFKKLYFTKIAEKYKLDIAKSLNLKPNQIFLVNKYKMQAKSFTEQEIFNIVKELIDLDYNYKIGNIDINIGLESILCKNCSK